MLVGYATQNDIIKYRGDPLFPRIPLATGSSFKQDDATAIILSKRVSLSRIERFLPTNFLFTSDRLQSAARRRNATVSLGTRVLVKLLRRIVRNKQADNSS